MTLLTDQSVDVSCKAYSSMVIDDTVAWNAGTGKTKTSFSQVTGDHLTFANPTETIDNLQLQAHGINIYQQYKAAFFRDYQTYTFGGMNIITPEDKGVCMMNFCLYPKTYQPSGHINVSRAREFYLQFVSSYCGSSTQCDLLVLTQTSTKKALIGLVCDIRNISLKYSQYYMQNSQIAKNSLQLCVLSYIDLRDKIIIKSQNHTDWTIRSQVVYLLYNIQCSSTTKRELVLANFVY
jgi:hypothetical protein